MTPPSRTSAGLHPSSWGVHLNPLSQMWEAAKLPTAAVDVPETSTPQQKSDRPATQPGDGTPAPAHTPAPAFGDEQFSSPVLKLPEMAPAKQVSRGQSFQIFPQSHASIAVDLSLHIR